MPAERGNRIKCRVNGTDSATCIYDAMNRLTKRVQDGTVYGYTYDKRGNLTEESKDGSPIRQYVYDTANRMVTGKDLLSGAQTDYTYNALNMRIANTLTLPGTEAPQIRTTAYVPDFLSGTDNDLMAYHSGGGVTKAVYGRTYERLGSVTAAGQKYEMPDIWGSPVYEADAQGNAEWRAGHDIWGRPDAAAAETDADIRFTNYRYDPVIGKYFAQARFYDSGQGRMLSPDPIKRRINPYPYCDNDPVNYNDPTGEIPSILLGAGLGGVIDGASGFIGSAASQLTGGGKINWRKAAGAAANGAVVGAARGALIGSGAGIPIAFVTDFAAGSVGNAFEQGITTGKVNLGKSLLGGAENAISQMLYGTGELKGVKDAFLRGAKTGAVSSGLRNIGEALWPEEMPKGRGAAGAGVPGHSGRDPRKVCGSPDPFDLAETLGDRRRSQGGVSHGGGGRSRTGEGGGFSLGGLVKDMLIGGIVGGLGSAAFYGAGEAVDALKRQLAGSGSGNIHRSGKRPDFYVAPNGDIIPATGYRYFARNTSVVQNARRGYIAARSDGMYFSFDKIDDAIIAQGKLQIPYRPEYRISFDTLDIIEDIHIPKGKWGLADYLEPIAKDYKSFGPGGATQAVTYSKIESIPLINNEIFAEYEEVLSRPKFNFEPKNISVFFAGIEKTCCIC